MKESTESVIEISDMSLDAFNGFYFLCCLLKLNSLIGLLEYIYCDEVSLKEPTAMELLQIADKYCVAPLKALCEQFLGKCLTAENVIELGILADKVEAKELEKMIIKFVRSNPDAVFERVIFEDFLKHCFRIF